MCIGVGVISGALQIELISRMACLGIQSYVKVELYIKSTKFFFLKKNFVQHTYHVNNKLINLLALKNLSKGQNSQNS